MNKSSTPDFRLDVDGIAGTCPAGEAWAEQNLADGRIPVFSCEGPCIRGEIARRAANMVANEEPYARCCYAETFFVPHSAMLHWAREADRAIVVDGCFLQCVGRVMNNLLDRDRIVHVDALRLYRKYTDVFRMEDVGEEEKQSVARDVADQILARLRADAAAVPANA